MLNFKADFRSTVQKFNGSTAIRINVELLND